MNFKRKIYLFIVLVVLILLVLLCFPENPALVAIYDRWIYYPFQICRGVLFDIIPFSVGDVLYVAGGVVLLFALIKWVKYGTKFRDQKIRLASSAFNTMNVALFVYLFFVFGWGANYYKLPVRESWALRAHKDTLELVQFDSLLVSRLNTQAPAYKPMSFNEVNKMAVAHYKTYTDTRLSSFGLTIKPTMFGYFMNRLSIEGYYNPFTGEGQLVGDLPDFMLPFVISHEMAHQAGIAAEGDANLVAYALGTMSTNATFNYSANLNLWLYVNARLFRRDSFKAKAFEAQLNELTKAHLDTLDELSKLGDNEVSRYSTEMYDGYLKMQQQKDGIHSYGSVTANAWLFELKRKRENVTKLHIP